MSDIPRSRIVSALQRARAASRQPRQGNGRWNSHRAGAHGDFGGAIPGEAGQSGSALRQSPGMAIDSSHPDQRDPQGLGSVLDHFVVSHGWQTSISVGSLIARWDEIMGDDIASHCRPETFDEGKLVIRCSSTSWATQMRLYVPQLQERLDGMLEPGTVTGITVLGPAAPGWRKGRRRIEGRGPRDTYG